MHEYNFDELIVDIHYYNHRICTPSWEIKPRIAPFINFTYVVSGKGEYVIDGVRHSVKGGDLVCVQKGCSEYASSDPEYLMDCYCVNIFVYDLKGNEVKLPFNIVSHIGIREDIITLFQEMTAIWLLRDTCYKLKSRATFMMILAKCYQAIFTNNISNDNVTNKRIRMILQHVLDHYYEPLSVKEMAKMTNLSPLYFGTLFKQETGLTFRQYLTNIRINQAENLLSSGMYNVSEAAAECGFSDVFYFSKVFKEHRGISPSEVIKS
ncbi:MAG: AraC family transcriptional regulator [Clostridiaceae bacterium]|jgi:AraC-like DNA-binding protein|nr:AraC family transcriptional regulator [Clostridiaceae bacterium]